MKPERGRSMTSTTSHCHNSGRCPQFMSGYFQEWKANDWKEKVVRTGNIKTRKGKKTEIITIWVVSEENCCYKYSFLIVAGGQETAWLYQDWWFWVWMSGHSFIYLQFGKRFFLCPCFVSIWSNSVQRERKREEGRKNWTPKAAEFIFILDELRRRWVKNTKLQNRLRVDKVCNPKSNWKTRPTFARQTDYINLNFDHKQTPIKMRVNRLAWAST